MSRITNKDLERLALQINEATNSPKVCWENGKANVGCYHISGAYSGVSLHRVCNEGGGISTVLATGYIPKRELFHEMTAFLRGIYTAKNR